MTASIARFATVATLEEIAAQDYSLSIPLYVRQKTVNSQTEERHWRKFRQTGNRVVELFGKKWMP
ncbi:MAG: hypothetical protein RMY34_06085 [Aulosira sp. DedQUE10]|nr:hypothetical protein [Aulosira sp. DedQUE10]